MQSNRFVEERRGSGSGGPGYRSGIVYSAALLSLCMLTMPLAAQTGGNGTVTETHAFEPGQTVHFEMNVGELKIVRSPREHQIQMVIVPRMDTSDTEVHSWVKQFDVSGKEAHIRVELPKKSKNGQDGPRVTLYLPAQATLNADLEVGQMTGDGIGGDKDLHVGVGELDIQGIDAHDYGDVETTTGVGDVQDSIFSGKPSGWLGKSETAHGGGKYRIYAKVGVGSIRLRDSGNRETD